MTLDEIREIIATATAPDKMSKAAAKEFLEEIEADVRGSIDALNDELDA